jgi:hypothetical protein
VLELAPFLPFLVYGELLCVVFMLAFVKRLCVAGPASGAPIASGQWCSYLKYLLGARCLKLFIDGFTRGFVESVFIQPLLYRVFGLDIRYGAEIDTCDLGAPDCLVVGESAMINGGATVGQPVVFGGRISIQPTVLGRRCFLGNNSLVPQGAKLSDNTLLGVSSCSPAYMTEHSTYLGRYYCSLTSDWLIYLLTD